MFDFAYRCIECGREYPVTPAVMRCGPCADKQKSDEPLRGLLEVQIGREAKSDGVDRQHDPLLSWNINDLLPVENEWFPPIPVGGTPLWEPERLRSETGFERLYIKDDGANPTGSLKDRASYLVAAFAGKHGIDRIVLASTGNAGSSMAGVGAAAGLSVRLYLPAIAPKAKLVQALQYGAEVVRVEGNYDLAYDEATAFAAEGDALSRNTGFNPLTIEGKKTVSLEIFRQLSERSESGVPDYIFVPAGDGVIVSGVYRGFEDLVALGMADIVPRVIAVQAEGSAAIARAMRTGAFGAPEPSHTVADSISVDVPRGGYFALGRLQRHSGEVITVSDDQILAAQRYLASRTGLFAEPAAAAAVAGFLDIRHAIPKEATVVLLITGTGLKDIDSAAAGVTIDE